jgi:hypothetical protein
MKKLLFLTLFYSFCGQIIGQTKQQKAQYDSLVPLAKDAFKLKNYEQSAQLYLNAVKALGYKGFAEDRYEAAKALAMSGQIDSSFAYLNILFEKTLHLEYNVLVAESLFNPLKLDARWIKLVDNLRPEMPDLAKRLEEINRLDQDFRHQLTPITEKYGWQSSQRDSLWKKINLYDSLNLIEIRQMIDTYGWLSAKQVGHKGNSTIYLVIQHSDLPTQLHYLPIMQSAADSGKARCADLAYLEDRILMRQRKKQLYGSQYTSYSNGESKMYPVEDVDNLNVRRQGMGLNTLSASKIEEIKQTNGF